VDKGCEGLVLGFLGIGDAGSHLYYSVFMLEIINLPYIARVQVLVYHFKFLSN